MKAQPLKQDRPPRLRLRNGPTAAGFLPVCRGCDCGRRGHSRYRKGWRPARSRRSRNRRAVVRHPSPAKCRGYRAASPRHALRADAGERALPDRYQYLSAIDQRSLVAVEDPRPRRPAARMEPCRPSCPAGNASVHRTFVHFQHSRRRSDRHHAVERCEPYKRLFAIVLLGVRSVFNRQPDKLDAPSTARPTERGALEDLVSPVYACACLKSRTPKRRYFLVRNPIVHRRDVVQNGQAERAGDVHIACFNNDAETC